MKNIAILFMLFSFLGCTSPARQVDNANRVQHIVLCWLKEAGNEEHRQKIIDTSYLFGKIPGVVSVSAGEVIMSDREIVDDSFDVGIILTFASIEDMQQYLVHPEHKRAVKEELLPLTGKIVVYDFQE